jgi:hypothetical protein
MACRRLLVLLCCPSLAACVQPPPPPPSPSPALPSPTAALGPFTCGLPIDRGASGSGSVQASIARVGRQPGYDRIVFEYAGTAVPPFTIKPATPPFDKDPSGLPLAVSGEVFVEIVFREVPSIEGFSGPRSFNVGLPVVTDLEQRGDWEGVQQWIVGLSRQACIRVFSLKSPSRWVIDLKAS